MLPKETPELITLQLWPPNSSDLNVGNITRDSVQNMHHWSGAIDDVTDRWLPQWRHDPAWPTPFSVAVSVLSDSNLANLWATVEVG